MQTDLYEVQDYNVGTDISSTHAICASDLIALGWAAPSQALESAFSCKGEPIFSLAAGPFSAPPAMASTDRPPLSAPALFQWHRQGSFHQQATDMREGDSPQGNTTRTLQPSGTNTAVAPGIAAPHYSLADADTEPSSMRSTIPSPRKTSTLAPQLLSRASVGAPRSPSAALLTAQQTMQSGRQLHGKPATSKLACSQPPWPQMQVQSQALPQGVRTHDPDDENTAQATCATAVPQPASSHPAPPDVHLSTHTAEPEEPDPVWLPVDVLEVAETNCVVSCGMTPDRMLKRKVGVLFKETTDASVIGKDTMHQLRPGMYEGRVTAVRLPVLAGPCSTGSDHL